jgi:hypothetical protein
VPKNTVKNVIQSTAKRHAIKMLNSASMHMALEEQATSTEQIEIQVEKVMQQLMDKQPEWFWTDKHDYK